MAMYSPAKLPPTPPPPPPTTPTTPHKPTSKLLPAAKLFEINILGQQFSFHLTRLKELTVRILIEVAKSIDNVPAEADDWMENWEWFNAFLLSIDFSYELPTELASPEFAALGRDKYRLCTDFTRRLAICEGLSAEIVALTEEFIELEDRVLGEVERELMGWEEEWVLFAERLSARDECEMSGSDSHRESNGYSSTSDWYAPRPLDGHLRSPRRDRSPSASSLYCRSRKLRRGRLMGRYEDGDEENYYEKDYQSENSIDY